MCAVGRLVVCVGVTRPSLVRGLGRFCHEIALAKYVHLRESGKSGQSLERTDDQFRKATQSQCLVFP